jgi:alkanesulfonate monooxygenase SsuD/methylene tetrahydromethanopterin reductase-like flavin-dependent oxidoreductase (luciferase family)
MEVLRGGCRRRRPHRQPTDWCVSRNIFVADSNREAREIARRNSLGKCIEYIVELTRRTSPTGIGVWKRDAQMADAECNLDYFMDEVVIAGDPASVTSQLLALRERIGPFGTLVLVAHDWDDRQRWLHSLELFSREVVPALGRAMAA